MINQGKNYPGYVDGRTLIKHYCIDCGEKISYNNWKSGGQRCKSCSHKGELHPNYKGGIKTMQYFCKDCNSLITYETWRKGLKRCLSCSRKFRFKNPRNHPNWKGGLDKQPYGWNWTEQLKESIRKHDNYKCQNCGINKQEHLKKYNKKHTVHHIDYNKENCSKDNLIVLCMKCNSIVNKNRDYWFAYFTYLKDIL